MCARTSAACRTQHGRTNEHSSAERRSGWLPHPYYCLECCAPALFAQAASASLMLRHSPQAGLRGVAVDALRLLLGMRLLGNCLITLLFPLPLPLGSRSGISIGGRQRVREPCPLHRLLDCSLGTGCSRCSPFCG